MGESSWRNNFCWWQRGIIYQVYPRSFMDSNGDGIGDLGGIRQKLDYLQWLGVDAIWISPIYPSPMADFGYDISDYTDIDPIFGTLAEFDALLDDVHGRGMKLLLDYVPNHTSDRHLWFFDARASRSSQRRDWYIWRDPDPGGGPPNNWRANFGGSAWAWDKKTGQYYYHAFLREQPDLNWRNPQVQRAMHGCCASGSIAVSMVFASMSCIIWSKTPNFATIRRIQIFARACRPIANCSPLTR